MVSVTDNEIDAQCDSVTVAEGAQPVPDNAVTGHTEHGLTWLAEEGRWRLRVHRPLVGYRYEMYWPLPTIPTSATIRNDTRGWRRALLDLERGLRDGTPSAAAHAAQQVFDELTRDFSTLLSGGIPDHRYVATLFVYDEALLALRPVLSRKSWSATWVKHELPYPVGRRAGRCRFPAATHHRLVRCAGTIAVGAAMEVPVRPRWKTKGRSTRSSPFRCTTTRACNRPPPGTQSG